MEIDLTYCPQNDRVVIYSPDNVQYVTDDELVFNYIRGQIARYQLRGWKVKFNGVIYDIDNNGGIWQWPDGMFDKNEQLLAYILENGMFKHPSDLREELENEDVIAE